jgi:hypothetical protein
MLLYLVKHSRPDISNSVRELSKVADGATEGHFKALLSTVKYFMDTVVHCYNQSSSKMIFSWKEFQTVNLLEILTHASVYMVMSCTSVVHP